jgi:outer membrane protein TolC
LKENLDLAREVYDVINLQYRNGVKTYLEVITAETDLRTARINYYNALYQALSGKIDVQQALGQINY